MQHIDTTIVYINKVKKDKIPYNVDRLFKSLH